MALSLPDLIEKARGRMDEAVIQSGLSEQDVGQPEAFGQQFSDKDLAGRFIDAARYIAARVRARRVKELVSTRSGVNQKYDDGSDTPLYPNDGGSYTPFLRLLRDEVYLQNSPDMALRQTAKGQDVMGGVLLEVDFTQPTYVYQDYRLYTNIDGEALDVEVVELPTMQGTTFDGVSYASLSSASVPMPGFMEDALISYVAMTCYATEGRGDLYESAMQNLQNALEPYRLNFQSGSDE